MQSQNGRMYHKPQVPYLPVNRAPSELAPLVVDLSTDLQTDGVSPTQRYMISPKTQHLKKGPRLTSEVEDMRSIQIEPQSTRRDQSPATIEYKENSNVYSNDISKNKALGNNGYNIDPQNLPPVIKPEVLTRRPLKGQSKIRSDKFYLPKIAESPLSNQVIIEDLDERRTPIKGALNTSRNEIEIKASSGIDSSINYNSSLYTPRNNETISPNPPSSDKKKEAYDFSSPRKFKLPGLSQLGFFKSKNNDSTKRSALNSINTPRATEDVLETCDLDTYR